MNDDDIRRAKREEFLAFAHAESERKLKEWQEFYALHKDDEMLDEDGYPTEIALELIEKWTWHDEKGWFEFIKSIWYYNSTAWGEGEEPHDWLEDKLVYRYHISTIGWSGNEAIIRSMQKNDFLWYLVWVQSRRGGHYIFESREYES
jgi:hypothetical protein